MGIEDHIKTLTDAVVALRKAIEAQGNAPAGGEAASEDAPAKKAAPAKKPAAKKPAAKKVEPEHDKDEVAAIMRQAAREVDKAAVQSYISEQDCADLADLLTKPELYDAAFDFATGLLSAEDEEEGEEDDGI